VGITALKHSQINLNPSANEIQQYCSQHSCGKSSPRTHKFY